MINVVIIGCGAITRKKHAAAHLTSRRTNLYGFYDIRPEAVQEYTAKYGGRAYTSLEEVLADPNVQAVDICTRGETHCQIAVAALKAGKHVLCEKPMAATIAEAREMVTAARSRGLKLMLYHNQRLYPPHLKAKELLDSGLIGTLINYRTALGYEWPDIPFNPDGVTYRHLFKTDGTLSDGASHRVDLMMYLVGKPVEEVFCYADVLEKKYPDGTPYDCYDNGTTILKYKGGVSGVIHSSLTVYGQEDRTTKLFGTKGVITVYGDDRPLYVGLRDGTKLNVDFGYPTPGQQDIIPVDVVDRFAQSIEEDIPEIIPGEDGLEGIRIIDAMYLSAAERRWVKLSEIE